MAIVLRMTVVCILALAMSGTQTIAGDGDYDPSSEEREPTFFGFVRDTRGAPVADARVLLQPRSGEALELKTNVLGLYRSHMSKETPVDEVSVSCEKPGYKQTNVLRRTPAGSGSIMIETNCTLQRI